jgi:hypothetical protein
MTTMAGAFGTRSTGSGSGIRPIAIMCRSRRHYLCSRGTCRRSGEGRVGVVAFFRKTPLRAIAKRIRRPADTFPPTPTRPTPPRRYGSPAALRRPAEPLLLAPTLTLPYSSRMRALLLFILGIIVGAGGMLFLPELTVRREQLNEEMKKHVDTLEAQVRDLGDQLKKVNTSKSGDDQSKQPSATPSASAH